MILGSSDGRFDTKWSRHLSKNSILVPSIDNLLTTEKSSKRKVLIILKGVDKYIMKIIEKATGLIVDGYDHTIDNYFVSHAYNKHKNDIIPLQQSDFRRIPMILEAASTIYWSDGRDNLGKNRRGRPKQRNGVIVYEKIYADKKLVYLEEIRNTRRELAAKTLY